MTPTAAAVSWASLKFSWMDWNCISSDVWERKGNCLNYLWNFSFIPHSSPHCKHFGLEKRKPLQKQNSLPLTRKESFRTVSIIILKNSNEAKQRDSMFRSSQQTDRRCLFHQKNSEYRENTRPWRPWGPWRGLYRRAASLLGWKLSLSQLFFSRKYPIYLFWKIYRNQKAFWLVKRKF